jgi:hypothetical protein
MVTRRRKPTEVESLSSYNGTDLRGAGADVPSRATVGAVGESEWRARRDHEHQTLTMLRLTWVATIAAVAGVVALVVGVMAAVA